MRKKAISSCCLGILQYNDPESGHLDKDVSLGFLSQITTCFSWGTLENDHLELKLCKVSDLHRNYLLYNTLLLACSHVNWVRALPFPLLIASLSWSWFLGSVSNKSFNFTSFVDCTVPSIKTTAGFYFPTWATEGVTC